MKHFIQTSFRNSVAAVSPQGANAMTYCGVKNHEITSPTQGRDMKGLGKQS